MQQIAKEHATITVKVYDGNLVSRVASSREEHWRGRNLLIFGVKKA